MGRSPCCDKNALKKGPWTPEEDAKLTHHIQMHGPGNWRTLPKIAGLERCGKSCRLRWTNYLRPDIKRGRFSFEEEETIIQLHSVLGNKWSAIAARLPGRTDNEIKNYWNTHIRKRLLKMGIDPVTHSPRLDLLDLSSLLMNNSPHLNNLSNLIRLQTLVNPEALRVALTLLSSHEQNDQNNHLLNYPNILEQQIQNTVAPPVVIQPNQTFDNIINQQIPWTFATSSLQGGVGPTYSNSTSDDQSLYNGVSSDQMKADNNNSRFDQSFNGMDFSFDSVISTPEPNMSGSTEEYERESFCSDLFKFEIPEGFDYFDDFM
ncbi:hypothetical protein ABFS82_13G023400 [Erythranthe guttata]|uniref:Uncharacterized protein n=1 Tax=Erythranthe guttata TaxID=4155 RepID=A0A022QC63_ERYGU|nr:PREDICTED: protein ODORANT1 [Erythranthe guttata]EYU24848.1 hypothetical protein MIMGU_mgv1a025831mg [Erythranthe guttata]|eukprot:XP_012852372.1 PREDICTED: protein ODORANT1 [Erythranthe guttata]